MKRLFLLSCVALLTLSFSCSAAMADVKEHLYHVSPPTHIESLREFNISSEVNALRQAKAKRDNAIKNSDGSEAAINAAYRSYEAEKEKQFKKAWNRRRAQYAQSRVTVTKMVQAVAVPPQDYGKCKYDMRLWGAECTVRIDCPSPGLKPLPSYGCREICRSNPSGHGDFYVARKRIENNGFTYTMQVTAREKDHWFVCLFQANFAYTDAYLNALADHDLPVLKDRIMMAIMPDKR